MTRTAAVKAAASAARERDAANAALELERVRQLVRTTHARFVCVDVEAWERETTTITEIGLAQWCDLASYGSHWTFTHLIIAENAAKRNGRYVEDNQDSFIFGQSRVVSMDEAREIAKDALARADFIVGHDLRGDLKWLRLMGVALDLAEGRLVDTQQLAAGLAHATSRCAGGALVSDSRTAAVARAVPISWSLKRLVKHFLRVHSAEAQQGWGDFVESDAAHPLSEAERKQHSGDLHLHNGGNDAAWTMAVMLSICNRDAEWLRTSDGGASRYAAARSAYAEHARLRPPPPSARAVQRAPRTNVAQRIQTLLRERAQHLPDAALSRLESTSERRRQIEWLAAQLSAELALPDAVEAAVLAACVNRAMRDERLMRQLLSRAATPLGGAAAPANAEGAAGDGGGAAGRAIVGTAVGGSDADDWWTLSAFVGKKPAREAAARRALHFLGAPTVATGLPPAAGSKSAMSTLQELLQQRCPGQGNCPQNMYRIEERRCGEQLFEARVVLCGAALTLAHRPHGGGGGGGAAAVDAPPSRSASALALALAPAELHAAQRSVLKQILRDDGNGVVVMPQSASRTRITFEAIRSALARHPTRAVLYLCPTVPLVGQMRSAFAEWAECVGLVVDLKAIAGGKGGATWDEIRAPRSAAHAPVVIVATPGSCTRALASAALLARMSLLVVDECNGAVGSEHPYGKIAAACVPRRPTCCACVCAPRLAA